jgi:hypothetical protein
MPGSFGTSPTEDGASASTASSEHPGGAGVFGYTVVPQAAGVFGANGDSARGVGVQGNGPEAGVSGFSESGAGLRAHSSHGDGTASFAHDSAGNGLLCMNDAKNPAPTGGAPRGNGILAVTTVPGAAGAMCANNDPAKGVGVQGNGPEAGVSGFSEKGAGLQAHSNHGDGTRSFAHSSDRNGLLGLNDAKTKAPAGSAAPVGNGVYGYTDVPNGSGVCGAVAAGNQEGAGVTGIGPVAGRFFGNVVVTGDITLSGADYAEDFDTVDPQDTEPGSVMVLDDAGALRLSTNEYDARVAGVVSGAGEFRPAVILDRETVREDRVPVALMGKVYCKVDASHGPVKAGDMLTTSPTPGHAMRAGDRARSFGAVLGKALRPLDSGRGLVPILVTLQ